MLTDICSKNIEQLYATPIVQQTAFWSVVKQQLGASTLAINFKSRKSSIFNHSQSEDKINSDVLLIIQYINHHQCVAYVPYGPELEPDEDLQGKFLEELSESIRSYLPKNCIMIRYDLCWESYWSKDKSLYDGNGNWFGEPEIQSQEIRFNINTVNWNFKKAHSNILPANTIFLNLQVDLDKILGKMKPKTRYNINLASKRGVTIRAAGIESIQVWYKLYQETASRNNIYLNEIKYFEAVLSAKADNTHSPAEVHLLIAEMDNRPLAAMFLIISSNRGSYLYGASSDINRNSMATYALQWEAIKISKAKGCTEYDMFGIAPKPDQSHPLYGLYKFKAGFGGDIFHSLGCWDYPLDVDSYNCYRHSELMSQKFHNN